MLDEKILNNVALGIPDNEIDIVKVKKCLKFFKFINLSMNYQMVFSLIVENLVIEFLETKNKD